MKLRNSSLKSVVTKLEQQMSLKEEIGDALHYIDFHQLQIENKQYVTQISEKNEELLNLKLSTGKTLQVLNNLKKKLKEELEASEWLKNELSVKTNQLDRLVRENSKVTKDTVTERHQRTTLRIQAEETEEMPKIDDYIVQKKDMYELESSLKNWKRKVEIANMAARMAKSRTRSMQTL